MITMCWCFRCSKHDDDRFLIISISNKSEEEEEKKKQFSIEILIKSIDHRSSSTVSEKILNNSWRLNEKAFCFLFLAHNIMDDDIVVWICVWKRRPTPFRKRFRKPLFFYCKSHSNLKIVTTIKFSLSLSLLFFFLSSLSVGKSDTISHDDFCILF